VVKGRIAKGNEREKKDSREAGEPQEDGGKNQNKITSCPNPLQRNDKSSKPIHSGNIENGNGTILVSEPDLCYTRTYARKNRTWLHWRESIEKRVERPESHGEYPSGSKKHEKKL